MLAPLRSFGAPLLDLIRPKPYLEHQAMFDPPMPDGWRYHWKSCDVAELTDDLVDTLAHHTAAITSPRSHTLVFQLGGAVGRVAEFFWADPDAALVDLVHAGGALAGWQVGSVEEAKRAADAGWT